MIEFLKESTFAVNEAILKAWQILKGQYFVIASLCFLMFITLWASSAFGGYLRDQTWALRIPLGLLFIVAYFGLQLTLFSFALSLISDRNDFTEEFYRAKMYNNLKLILSLIGVAVLISVILGVIYVLIPVYTLDLGAVISLIILLGCVSSLIIFRRKLYPLVIVIRNNWPSGLQLLSFLSATIFSIVILAFVVLLIGALFFPLRLIGVAQDIVVELALSVGFVLALILLIRISFFPLFIMDRRFNPFKALRFSLAITRGNFTRLVLLFCCLGISHFLALYFSSRGLVFLGALVSVVNSFIVVPLSSLVTAVAYRQMISEYKGDEDPDVIHNLI